ncbi:uncharacterized protein EDB93DRAFT_1241168 [Suillus bovinus]|uniref:uncharacterized protein n=1 Tax=Suillus bovinus TaxID=48563 RepID=UPI001B8860B4|nr:uncharacterized protein EDB93DRAFT_1241168 [Suillus bovinus]KAG2145323.1 hypothetical protein EDB93DRAFT_1241168 [Suillus bovinus]
MSASPDSTHAALFGEESTFYNEAHPGIEPSVSSDTCESDIDRCSHITSVLADPSAKAGIIDKYKTVVAWHARRTHNSLHPAKRRKISSPTCVDAKFGSVFCSDCDDFVFDDVIDDLHLSTVLSVEEQKTKFKGREPYQPWIPTDDESTALKYAATVPCQGRRGLLNLGQTCFLNVVLQSFIHNPLLRNYFLSDRHNSRLCKHSDCTCCEMDNLFTEIYSPTNTPFGPTSFLATTWKVSAEMSGYAQQDAHEFFITALNQIHGTCRGSTNISCNCIIHQTFAGQFQSDVTCEKCGTVTSTIDPMLDISLELRSKSGEPAADNTLASCLRSKCTKASHEAVKRLSIRTLPPVLSFQFKRFEHKTSGKAAPQKIDAPIRIPVSINMAPYTTLAMNATGKDGETGYPGPDAMYEYDLFAVINHEGQMDNGHYTNFARFQDEWYRFDDDKVTPSTLSECLASNAYMCFYVKRHLDYKPYVKPTYLVAREKDIVREQAMEREKEAARMKEVDDALMAMVGGD